MRDPFRYKGQLVVLVVSEEEAVDDGSVEQTGMPGIKFDRMISENVAIYDVLEGDFVHRYSSNYDSTIGQIAVFLPDGIHAPLDRDREWNVEPLGMTEGTNGFGAKIGVPSIQFWGYVH